jgi:hypothetical protein
MSGVQRLGRAVTGTEATGAKAGHFLERAHRPVETGDSPAAFPRPFSWRRMTLLSVTARGWDIQEARPRMERNSAPRRENSPLFAAGAPRHFSLTDRRTGRLADVAEIAGGEPGGAFLAHAEGIPRLPAPLLS